MPSTAAKPVVPVAVGILADQGRFFLTRRRLDTHLGGRWEFPGGKIDAGESALAALRRELREEIGIEVHDARPFMQLRHDYAEKTVLLEVWRVSRYSGSPLGREGQESQWATRDELWTLDLPEADGPIRRRLWLPGLYAISDCSRYGPDEFFVRLERALIGGLKLLQWREPEMAQNEFLALAREVVARCHHHGAKVLLNTEAELVETCGADGVHLNSRRLLQTVGRPLSQEHFVAASCHNETELARAAQIGADAVVIGPVAPTASHVQATVLGWARFGALCRAAVPAVYALGGMRAENTGQARACDAQGVAMIRGLWEAPDIAAVVAACDGIGADQARASSR